MNYKHVIFPFPLIIILVMSLFYSCNSIPKEMPSKVSFANNWSFLYDSAYYSATIPGCIHTDLLAHQLIPDPFFGTNEDSLQWISHREWTYKTHFDMTDIPAADHVEFVFQGVDCYADFFLNGEPFCHQEGTNHTYNSYREWRFQLPEKVKEKDNELVVKFYPSDSYDSIAASKLPYSLPERRAFSRKHPYQSGWDWGPKLVTCGIWKECFIETWNDFRVKDVQIVQTSLDDTHAVLNLVVEVEADKDLIVEAISLVDSKINQLHKDLALQKGTNRIELQAVITNPERWNPNGLGTPKLYDIGVNLTSKKWTSTHSQKFGLRTIVLETAVDSIGSQFQFVVNGQPCFMKGVNWIPADYFTSRLTEEHYRDLIQSCKDANMNMIRIWGGGIYENDLFYDLCDEMGIMVWQDFMFSCALYPADSLFLNNVKQEVIEQMKRLRNHPCLALWCGNNEVKNGWEDWGWQNNYTEEHRKQLDDNLHYLFNEFIPEIVAQYDATRQYHPSSPLWGWGHDECNTEGDSHYWGVWWGELPFEMWEPKTGRFMSEYGFQSYPSMNTIRTFTDSLDRTSLNSPSMKNHQKTACGIAAINKAMKQYFMTVPLNLEKYVYLSQLVQSYGIGDAIETHRRKMPYCMGTLYWQLNDCWPVASWSSIDYNLNWKPLHYEVARKFQPIIISTPNTLEKNVPIWLVSDLLKNVEGSLSLKLIDFYGKVLDSTVIENVSALANNSSLIAHYQYPKNLKIKPIEACLVITFNAKDYKPVQKIHYFEYPFRLMLPRNNGETTNEGLIYYDTIRCDSKGLFNIPLYTKYLKRWVSIETNESGKFSDNYFDMLPFESRNIIFTPKNKDKKELIFKMSSYNFNQFLDSDF